jgi:hypothetical protein
VKRFSAGQSVLKPPENKIAACWLTAVYQHNVSSPELNSYCRFSSFGVPSFMKILEFLNC